MAPKLKSKAPEIERAFKTMQQGVEAFEKNMNDMNDKLGNTRQKTLMTYCLYVVSAEKRDEDGVAAG